MRHRTILILLAVSIVVLFVCNLVFGSVSIPFDQALRVLTGGEADKASWNFIILQSRLPQAITALMCGASLAVSGLVLQTFFRNPLAGPSVLGISNGASLGVAIVMLSMGGVVGAGGEMGSGLQLGGSLSVVTGAFMGAVVITMLYLGVTKFLKNNLVILIMGIMVGYLSSSAVTLLNFFATVENVHSYVSWGMGSFSNVSLSQLPLMCGISLLGIVLAMVLIKSFNALLLGEDYASNLGINLGRVRRTVLLSTGILTAVTTAFCGPISFIGLAVPHIARMVVRTSDHKVLLPATMLTGGAIAMLCNLICVMPQQMIIPLNAVTPIFGAPVIIYIILKRKY
ncbi:MAG: iron ABC transporter permease [Bacteroidaceae bacterium]|nr:iron ABC transporter permease [Bacteroidaceae bacterium]